MRARLPEWAASIRLIALSLVLGCSETQTVHEVVREAIPNEAILFRVQGDTPGDWFGYAVTALGDVTGDSIPDFAVGAHQNKNWGHGEPGYVRVYSGSNGEELYTLLSSGSQNIDGGDDHFGASLTSIDDLDGDGAREVVVGSYLYDASDENTGAVFLFSGASGEPLKLLPGRLWGDRFGWAVSTMPDMDGDQRQELLIGAEKTDEPIVNSGSIQVLSSADFSVLVRSDGPSEEAHLGCSCSPMGDVDGDGVPDYAAGAFMLTVEGEDTGEEGAAGVFSGATGEVLHFWYGSQKKDHLGYAIARLRDADGDGIDELAVGANQSGYVGDYFGPGYVRLYSGGDGSLLSELRGEELGDQFGWSITDVGDRNEDGRADLLIGAPASISVSEVTLDRPGRVYLYSGADRTLLKSFHGLEPNDQLGVSAALIGDIDGDGQAEVLIGAPQNGPGQERPGYAVVVSGSFLRVDSR